MYSRRPAPDRRPLAIQKPLSPTQAKLIRAVFCGACGLTPKKLTWGNVRRVLDLGGASDHKVQPVFRRVMERGLLGEPAADPKVPTAFFGLELFVNDSGPMALVAFPTQRSLKAESARVALDELRGLGLDVGVSGLSWREPGTQLLIVTHLPTLAAAKGMTRAPFARSVKHLVDFSVPA